MLRNRLLQIRQQLSIDAGVKITGEEMGEMLSMGQRVYSRYETQKSQPSLRTALRIAKALSKYTGRKYIVEDIFYEK